MSARLLIVESDPAELLMAAQVLQPEYEVATASDASEARGKLISGLIDVLICDVDLPGESGMDLIRSLRARDEEVGVVVIAGEEGPDLATQIFEVGAYGYLVKPCRTADLRITVDQAVRRLRLDRQSRANQRELERDVMLKGLEAERMRMRLLDGRLATQI